MAAGDVLRSEAPVAAHLRLLSVETAGAVEEAAAVLRAGGLVVFPTDTLYALGADPLNGEALRRLVRAKGSRGKAIPLLLPGPEALGEVASEVPGLALVLASQFWPGPLTLVVRARPGLPEVLTGGTGTVGVRVPAGPVALGLLRTLGGPVTGTSANRTGERAPRQVEDVAAEFAAHLDLLLDGGACPVGVPSTVLDLTTDPPCVRRIGAVPVAILRRMEGLQRLGEPA
ncbi:MAG TPA: L-threonylcarbamoyladenylate synthase [Candidatus Methylomirabilis sp.]|jgi:L-threonylcarbamoyladenylate synthase|nr:L-threonylcarbamoyladenylate synthase [Candidatus Methylomirabilis sp.]